MALMLMSFYLIKIERFSWEAITVAGKKLGLSEDEVIHNVSLKATVDGEFTSLEDVVKAAVFLAGFESCAITGQSLIVSHVWFKEEFKINLV